jgi:hypothetical protein
MEGRRFITVCETISLSGAGWILVIEKGPFGPSFLVIYSASIKHINILLIEFL